MHTVKMYNKTIITQLGICKVVVEHKNNKKTCQFFVVPSNGQALLGMPDTDMLYIININIDSVDAESQKRRITMYIQKLSRGLMQSRRKMEVGGTVQTQMAFENMSTIAQRQGSKLILINQQTTFLQVPTVIVTKGRVLKLHNKYTRNLVMCLMALGALKAHFLYR